MNHISLKIKNRPRCYTKSPTAQDVFRSIPYQLRWGDWEIGTAISCTECSQMVWGYICSPPKFCGKLEPLRSCSAFIDWSSMNKQGVYV